MEIVDQLEALGFDEDCLDELLDEIVHDAAAQMASRVNNDGRYRQTHFLAEQGFSENQIISAVQDRAEQESQD